MNFDFSLAEQALFKDIQDRIKEYAEGKNLETQDISQVKDALAILGKTPYLKLGTGDSRRIWRNLPDGRHGNPGQPYPLPFICPLK